MSTEQISLQITQFNQRQLAWPAGQNLVFARTAEHVLIKGWKWPVRWLSWRSLCQGMDLSKKKANRLTSYYSKPLAFRRTSGRKISIN